MCGFGTAGWMVTAALSMTWKPFAPGFLTGKSGVLQGGWPSARIPAAQTLGVVPNS